MKKLILLIFILSGCSHLESKKKLSPEDPSVSVKAALMQAQASYLKGCVDGLKRLKIPLVFDTCRDMSLIHREEINDIMSQEIFFSKR